MDDPYNLRRFVTAQDAGGTFDRALDELRHGYKSSHWMWFIFPQIAGLGRSPTARQYAISSVDEARAYLTPRPRGPPLAPVSYTHVAAPAETRVERVVGAQMCVRDSAGLGRGPTARQYASSWVGAARAYLTHPVLGPRLV